MVFLTAWSQLERFYFHWYQSWFIFSLVKNKVAFRHLSARTETWCLELLISTVQLQQGVNLNLLTEIESRGNTTLSLWSYKLRCLYYIVMGFIGNNPPAAVPSLGVFSLDISFSFSPWIHSCFLTFLMMVGKHIIMDSTFWLVDILPPAFSFVFGVATEDPVTRSRVHPSPLCCSISSCNFSASIRSAT